MQLKLAEPSMAAVKPPCPRPPSTSKSAVVTDATPERVSTLAGGLWVSDEGDGTVLPSSHKATLVALWGPWSYDHGPSGSDPLALPR